MLTAEFVREGDDLLLAATDGTNSSAAAGLAHVIFDQTHDTLYFDVDSWTDGCTVLATIEGVADAVFASDVIFFRGRIDTDGASTRQIVKGRLVN